MSGGRGKERPAGEERTKEEIQDKRREPEDPRGPEMCAGETTTPGARKQTGQGHTLQRGAPWTGLGAGAAHTPLEDGGRKKASGRCLALSRFSDRSTLQPCCPSALGPDTGGERITPSVPIFRPQRPRGGTSESRPLLGRSSCYPSSPPDGGMHRTRGEFPCQAEWIHLSPATSIGPHRTWAQTWDPHLDPAQREGRTQVCVVCSVGPARDRDWGRSILRRDAP